jgi:hypothetical protein
MAVEFDTAVVGGGLSGMIAAYELAKSGHRVVLYDKQGELGGFARSQGIDQSFDEHSWRSFGDFYTNLRDVTDELGIPWPTASVRLTPFPAVPFSLTKGDLAMVWRLLRGMASGDLHRQQSTSWFGSHKDLSPWGMITLGRFNKSGSDYQDIPEATIVRVVELVLPFKSTFRISPLPIQEYLVNPLHRRLVELGVTIRLHHPVTTLLPAALGASTVVAAVPPSVYEKLDNTGMYTFALSKMKRLAADTGHQEISFRIVFNRRLDYPSRLTFDLHDTAWGLLMMPCELYYTDTPWTSTVWSGTCTYMRHKDRHGRTPGDCNPLQFQDSVLEQIASCPGLHEWFLTANTNLREALSAIENFRVWKAWKPGVDGRLRSSEVMAVNSFRETWSRPVAGSRLGSNVFLAGAHAGTGTHMWLMESAAEAGKLAAIEVLRHHNKDASRIFVDKHERHPRKLALISIGCAVGLLYTVSRMF